LIDLFITYYRHEKRCAIEIKKTGKANLIASKVAEYKRNSIISTYALLQILLNKKQVYLYQKVTFG